MPQSKLYCGNSIKLTGAPVKPIKGTFPSNLCLIIVIASPTYFKRSTAPVAFNLATSDGVSNGSGKTGPCNSTND